MVLHGTVVLRDFGIDRMEKHCFVSDSEAVRNFLICLVACFSVCPATVDPDTHYNKIAVSIAKRE